ncbi:hypothetical protein Glove_185g5 [Diversispora epigaea]|uniref:Uncharacterized protein n=1 Tax=Diversispora epigaea TaxID=1348612 RepID=A0A397ITN6_9GLOM|nr:hypothetical protein Glove_185g5 [Diversispora epigaea]
MSNILVESQWTKKIIGFEYPVQTAQKHFSSFRIAKALPKDKLDRLSDISPEFLFSVEEYEVLEIVLRNNLT